MNTALLKDMYVSHVGKVSDKWAIYFSVYDRIFASHRDKPIALLEIGIQNGGSLEIWSKYFAQAQCLIGCDINPSCALLTYESPQIHVVVGDANQIEIENQILGFTKKLDIIIDDGSHRSSDIVKSFARYFQHLAEGGVYVAEDLCCSYWQQWQGGLDNPLSSINFFKKLIDVVNFEHWGNSKQREDILQDFFKKYDVTIDRETLQSIHSVEFINSLCIIQKKKPNLNVLGERFIAGTVAIVDATPVAAHGTILTPPDQKGWW